MLVCLCACVRVTRWCAFHVWHLFYSIRENSCGGALQRLCVRVLVGVFVNVVVCVCVCLVTCLLVCSCMRVRSCMRMIACMCACVRGCVYACVIVGVRIGVFCLHASIIACWVRVGPSYAWRRQFESHTLAARLHLCLYRC